MTTTSHPAVLRRRLRVELKKARAATSMTQRDIADQLDWSPSKIIRIENGAVAISTTDLKALLDAYGVTDRRRIEELVSWAKASRRQPGSQYKEILQPEAIQLFGYEADALILRNHEPAVIPGLLQIEDYTRALMKDAANKSDSDIDIYIEYRAEHQELLERSDRPELFFMLDESVLRRQVGSPEIMSRQLEHLIELNTRDNLTIQILPFSIGAHSGMTTSFVYLEFPPEQDDVLYLENDLGDRFFREDPGITSRFLQIFWDLEAVASRPHELEKIIEKVIDSFRKDDQSDSTEPTVV
jgi:transcriptional regulator with XRE-family HTH domain